MDDSYTLATPEQVDLDYDVAGLGSRFLALLLDSLIQFALLVALIIAASMAAGLSLSLLARGRGVPGFAGPAAVAIIIIVFFLVFWGYFIFFEMAWNGQTPGKRALGLRVLTNGGQPITLAHTLVRNLVRLVDMLPALYMIGALAILVSRRSQRLGDLAAGTLVVKVGQEAVPSVLEAFRGEPLSAVESARFSAEDIALARDLLLRGRTLPNERRDELAERLAARYRERLEHRDGVETADALLRRVAALRR